MAQLPLIAVRARAPEAPRAAALYLSSPGHDRLSSVSWNEVE
jgi:hypothetical protein